MVDEFEPRVHDDIVSLVTVNLVRVINFFSTVSELRRAFFPAYNQA
jgi:hypothetical protein